MVDLMYWIGRTGFRSAYSYERNVGEPGNGGMQNVTGAVFELENGGVATLNMDYFRPEAAATHGDDRLRVAGTKGILEYRMQDGLFALGSGDRTSVKPPIEAPPYPLFLDFLLHIYQQREMLIRPEEVFQVVEIVNAARRSSDGGCAIHVGT